MPIIQVQVLEGKTDEQIKNLIAQLTESTVRCLNVKPEQVRVLVNEVPKKHWAVAGYPRKSKRWHKNSRKRQEKNGR